MTDTGGQASFDYDLLGRLTEWHNPFAETPIGGEPTHSYSVDDAGNITREEVTGGDEDVTITQSYSQGRLTERRAQLEAGVATITIDQYSVMGEEKQRTTTLTPTGGPSTSETLATEHDAQGHTASMTHSPAGGKPRVDFVYDGFDRLMARTSDGRTKLFFYFGDSDRLAEETSATGTTKSLYLNDSAGRPIAEAKDGNWTWLLRDAEGSVATRLSDGGNVKSHSAYDPYGASNEAGSGIAVGERDPETELGYQSESADAVTGNILVGPRQYDPTTQRFTTADVFIDVDSDLSLATDPLTGNRYLFAAANPVALDDDGHRPACGASSAACESSSDPSRGRTPTSADREYAPQGGSSTDGGGGYSSGASIEFVVVGGGYSGSKALFAAVMMPIYRDVGGGGRPIPVGPLGPFSRSAPIVPRAPTQISGHVRHGIHQSISRDGGLGVSARAKLDAVRHAQPQWQTPQGTFRYVGKDAVVILNPQGRVVTTWARTSQGWRNPPVPRSGR